MTRQAPVLRSRNEMTQERRQPTHHGHDAAYVEYHGENLTIEAFDDQSVDPNMLKDMHMDFASRKQLPPKLTDDALVEVAEEYLTQCSPDGVAVTYDQMLLQHIVPELVERLKEKEDC